MTTESILALIQQIGASIVTALSIDTGGTCGSHLVAAAVAAAIMRPAGKVGGRMYSMVRMRRQELEKR